MLTDVVVGVNHHLMRGGEISTGGMGNFHPALTVLCSEIAFDPKGDLWCLGTDIEARKAGDQSYPMIYRYSSLGSVVAKGVPRNSIKASASPELDS
ncbi:MAG: hypothetical protein Q7U44_08950, partial [Desulfuromonadales bacterium]|nr:hypothetical protein [Desulfuromonadales bacterium]